MAVDATMFRDALAQALALKAHEVHEPDTLADEIVDLIGVYVPAMDVMPLTLSVKLASLVVHAQEMNSPSGTGYDQAALLSLADDDEVKAWVAKIDPVFLPVKR